jgi:hypothetical protein
MKLEEYRRLRSELCRYAPHWDIEDFDVALEDKDDAEMLQILQRYPIINLDWWTRDEVNTRHD